MKNRNEIRKNDILTVDICDMNYLGMGVAKYNSAVIFVRQGVTGDRAEVKIIKEAKDYYVAIISKLLSPSSFRSGNDCPSFPRCGGCVYRHITKDYEAEIKKKRIINEFIRFGINDIYVHDVVTPKWENYRNKLEYPVSENGTLGFFAGHSHDIVPIGKCNLQEKLTDAVYSFISERLASCPKTELRHIYLRCGVGSGEVMVVFVSRTRRFDGDKQFADDIMKKFPEVVSVILNFNPDETNVILGKDCFVLAGKETLTDILCGLKFEIHPLSFYQVNHDCTELLYRKAAELAKIDSDDTLADLYCGIGTVGLCIASIAPPKRIFGVEIIPKAVENAKKNAKINGFSNAEYICGKAEDTDIGSADVVILDPPRKGCAASLIEYLGRMQPERIVYISCSPDTLARDCALLISYGYKIKEAFPFNMFPRTEHVETVVCLERNL